MANAVAGNKLTPWMVNAVADATVELGLPSILCAVDILTGGNADQPRRVLPGDLVAAAYREHLPYLVARIAAVVEWAAQTGGAPDLPARALLWERASKRASKLSARKIGTVLNGATLLVHGWPRVASATWLDLFLSAERDYGTFGSGEWRDRDDYNVHRTFTAVAALDPTAARLGRFSIERYYAGLVLVNAAGSAEETIYTTIAQQIGYPSI